jgi:hypothetical protein
MWWAMEYFPACRSHTSSLLCPVSRPGGELACRGHEKRPGVTIRSGMWSGPGDMTGPKICKAGRRRLVQYRRSPTSKPSFHPRPRTRLYSPSGLKLAFSRRLPPARSSSWTNLARITGRNALARLIILIESGIENVVPGHGPPLSAPMTPAASPARTCVTLDHIVRRAESSDPAAAAADLSPTRRRGIRHAGPPSGELPQSRSCRQRPLLD